MKAAAPRRLVAVAVGVGVIAVLAGFLLFRGGDSGNGGGADGAVQFGSVAFAIDGAARQGSALCALLADTEQQRSRGLMERTDLGRYEGMIFRFPQDTSTGFYMRNTPMPLSIAWFDANGAFVSSADMAPCPDRSGCPTYSPTGPYRYALEVPQGKLPALGVGSGAHLRMTGNCP